MKHDYSEQNELKDPDAWEDNQTVQQALNIILITMAVITTVVLVRHVNWAAVWCSASVMSC